MDRRQFLRRPPAAAAPPPARDAVELMPGQFATPALAERIRAPRSQPSDADRAAALHGPGGDATRAGGGLEPYVPTADMPWTRARARHLLRRTGFGATARAVNLVQAMTPAEAVDNLVDGAAAVPMPPDPPWRDTPPPHYSAPQEERDAYWRLNDEWVPTYASGIIDRMIARGVEGELDAAHLGLREAMALMWHNHVVTDLEIHYFAPWLVRYWTMLQRNALGNVRTLVHEAGRDPAMLIYLNGFENRAGSPNENYARELFELFTMGIEGPDGTPNYTQADVTEAARALTGWGIDVYGETATPLDGVFVPPWHDDGPKTIFGQTGPWGYDDVVRLVFEQRAAETAHFVCRKLYRTFVHHVPDEAVVAALADRLLAADFEIEPVLRALLGSRHFFDASLVGAAIRSPIQGMYGISRELGLDPDAEDGDFPLTLAWAANLAGQWILYPPNVAGWPGGRNWIDTSRLSTRWSTVNWVVWRQNLYRELTRAYPTPTRVSARALTRALADDWLGLPVGEDRIDELVTLLLNGQDEQYWDPDDPSAEPRLRGLILRLSELPEYQLA